MIVFVLAIFPDLESAEEFTDGLEDDTPYQIIAFDQTFETVQ